MTDTRDVDAAAEAEQGISLLDLVIVLVENRKLLIGGPLLIGCAVLALTFVIKPTYTAKTVFLPPQQQQITAAAAAMQSLGSLAGLAGAGVRNPIDQYIAFMQSNRVADRVIDTFNLVELYGKPSHESARKVLASNVRVEGGKRDGLITVEFDDKDPKLAAAIANNYVDQLRKLTAEFVITEAQQRRALFERQLQKTRDKLTAAQQALQGSGINAGVLRTEPKAAADAYASIKAQVTAAEIRLQSMRNYLTEEAPDFKLAQANLTALRGELLKAEAADKTDAGGDYIGKYREFRYQETLFELFSKQYELAKLDETREGAVIQVLDVAMPPEHKSKPKRAVLAVVSTVLAELVLLVFVSIRQGWRRRTTEPESQQKLARLRAALAK